MIDDILKGEEENTFLDLVKIIESRPETEIVLGCTELSLFYNRLAVSNKRIIDPLEIITNKILEKSYGKYLCNPC